MPFDSAEPVVLSDAYPCACVYASMYLVCRLDDVLMCRASDLPESMGLGFCIYIHLEGSILFANHKANGVVTNIGLSR